MKRFLAIPVLVFVLNTLLVRAQDYILHEKQSFNGDWLFQKSEFIDASVYEFDDTDWESVTLPHDWAVEGPFAEEFDPRTGGLPYVATGWYRKHFYVPQEFEGKSIVVHFDGAMKNARVWLNGHLVGERPYGYSSFFVDLTEHVNFGDSENVLAVKLNPEDLSSRWYSGAGLYRNVWLEINEAIYIAHWGTYITTPEISEKKASIRIQTELNNTLEESKKATLEFVIRDNQGNSVADKQVSINIEGNSDLTANADLVIKDPLLWDIGSPNLYTLETRLIADGNILDESSSEFGVRSIEFLAGKGFFLNGQHLRLQGVCMHHDLGPLGAAVNRRAVERQLEIMMSMGVNALRTAHNPPSPEVLEYCDKLGILVIDEAFDCWEKSKVPNDYGNVFSAWHEKDLRDMIRRDRNHPSVIMWSIGNEILEQGTKEKGRQMARYLSDICHEEDSTRPTTAGFNYFQEAIDNGLAGEVDIVGFNYFPAKYAEVIEQHPDWIIYGSETASTVSSRGVYHFPIEKYQKHPSHQITSYDLIGPPWAYPPDIEFRNLEKAPAALGEFIWTGFDYLGEPTPFGGRDNQTHGRWKGDWPSRSAYFGTVDLCGFPKDRYYLYQSQWTEEPMIHLLPHWNWEYNIGDTIPVYCYTNCDEAELFVNGKSVGKKIKGVDLSPVFVDYYFNEEGPVYMSKYRLSWEVPYQPGSIKVVGYNDGEQILEKEIRTAGKPANIVLKPDRNQITADGSDLSFIEVRIEDDDGNLCPMANNLVHFQVEGAGEIAAVGNGNPATTQAFHVNYRNAFNGLCMVIVKSVSGETGDIIIRAKSAELPETRLTINSVTE